ncbi:LysR family transcriptional regulator [Ottowia sp.]|uniref:LysR family transcriptional regulator n=1 Tax=Ottowia sp. TaxID=1898956 RepID=UPI00260590FB|nr:LysR family transcriptional regulator [Ottowia sp.]
MDRLDQLRVLVHVAETGSFTATARSLGLPRASVSLAVQQIERRLGSRLLHRTTRRVSLTSDGEAVLDRARQLVADAAELEDLLQRQPARLQGTLKVDVPSRVARQLVVPALPDLLQRHPELHLELGSNDRAVDLVQEGIDCVLRVGELTSSSLVARSLGHFRMMTCASAAYLTRHGTPVDLASLAGHRIVTYAPPGVPRPVPALDLVLADHRSALPALESRVGVNQVEIYLACALEGLGLIQVPAYDVQQFLADGQLVEVLPELAPPPLPVHLLYPHRKYLARRVQWFGDWLAGLLAPYLTPPPG